MPSGGLGEPPDVNIVEPEGRTMPPWARRAHHGQGHSGARRIHPEDLRLRRGGGDERGCGEALLKTLEEPSATTAFVLVADSEEDLPATLGSRCPIIHFGRVDEAEVVAALSGPG